jgi:hypothetical protein
VTLEKLEDLSMTMGGCFAEDVCWIEPDFLLDALTGTLAFEEKTLALPPAEGGLLAGAMMMMWGM